MRRFQHARSALISGVVRNYLKLAPLPVSKAFKAGLRARIRLQLPPYHASNPYKPGHAKFESFQAGFAFASEVLCRRNPVRPVPKPGVPR